MPCHAILKFSRPRDGFQGNALNVSNTAIICIVEEEFTAIISIVSSNGSESREKLARRHYVLIMPCYLDLVILVLTVCRHTYFMDGLNYQTSFRASSRVRGSL